MDEMNSHLIFDSTVENPLVTIAIPTLKRDVALIDAVISALNQDDSIPFDILVVDNNPERNDITEQAMSRFKDHPQVAYYKNDENIGMIGNWNRLYELSKGKYVTMLHDDDMLMPYYLYVVCSFLERTNFKYELVYPDFVYSQTRERPHGKTPNSVYYRIMKVQDFLVTQWGLPSGMMISKKQAYAVGGFDKSFYPLHDQEFIYRSLHFMPCAQIRYPLVHYYIGINESMRPDTMKAIIAKEKELNEKMCNDVDNNWRFLGRLTYRNQMRNIIKWGLRFVEKDVLEDAKIEIGLSDSWYRESLSDLFANFLKLYIFTVRIKKISLTDK